MLKDVSREPITKFILNGIVFLYPMGLGIASHWASGLFILALVVSLLTIRRGVLWPEKTEGTLFIAFALFFFLASLSLINAGDLGAAMRRLEKLLFLLLCFPLFQALKSYRSDILTFLLNGFVVAGFVMAGDALYDVYYLGLERAVGAYSHIVLGNVAMLTALMIIAGLYAGRFSGGFRYVAGLSFICSSVAATLSGTRGAWLALPIVLLLLTIRYFSWKKALLSAGIVGLFVLFVFVNDHSRARLDQVSIDLKAYVSGHVATSLGTRLTLYGHALEIWQEEPLIGIGIGNFRDRIGTLVAENKTGLDRDWSHAHNIFLDALASTGLLGLLGLVGALFFLPARYFLRRCIHDMPLHVHFSSTVGLVFLVVFAVFGMSETFLIHSELVAAFAFLLTIFIVASPCSASVMVDAGKP